ncbi:hypothetical protein J6590_078362 [Homalodisca vitripennis]|nr:hypothetical protein J6590_078362 [Homalodisca vitripennis]
MHINSPTRVTTESATAIDNIVTNLPGVQAAVVNTGISDHYPQQSIINDHEPARDPINNKTIRDTKAHKYPSPKFSSLRRKL